MMVVGILLIVLMLALAGCGSPKGDGGTSSEGSDGTETEGSDAENSGNDSSEEEAESSGETVRLTIGTGGTSGTYYPLGTALAQKIFNGVEGVQANAVSTGASVTNVQEMVDGKYQIALVQNDIAYYAANGETLDAFDGNPIDSIAGMAILYPEDIQVVTTKGSGIESIEDLKGKKVAVGDQGSGTDANTRQVLDAAGITYDDIDVNYVDFGKAAQGMMSGQLDAAFITAGAPTSAVQELGASKEIHVLSLSDEIIQNLIETYPYYTERTIPAADTYADYGQEEDIKTVAVQAMLVVDTGLSEDVMYDLTEAMFDNLDTLGNAHARGKDISLETALDGMPIDLHPGAQKYYEEQGLSIE